MKKTAVSLWVICASSMLILTACEFEKPKYPIHARPTIEATISSDGKLFAASAKTDFAQLLSLYDLSPSSLSVSDAAATEPMDAVAA